MLQTSSYLSLDLVRNLLRFHADLRAMASSILSCSGCLCGSHGTGSFLSNCSYLYNEGEVVCRSMTASDTDGNETCDVLNAGNAQARASPKSIMAGHAKAGIEFGTTVTASVGVMKQVITETNAMAKVALAFGLALALPFALGDGFCSDCSDFAARASRERARLAAAACCGRSL